MYFLNKFCCICMNKSDLKHLFDVDNDGVPHYNKLTSSVAEMHFKEMNDQRLICGECSVTLNTVYTFRQTCLRSKTNLITYISQLQTFSKVSGTLSIRLTDIKHEITLVKEEIEIKCENDNNSSTFEETYPLSEFKTESYEESIQFPASVKKECESEKDSSAHEDATVDHVNEGALNDVKVEDVETMMEDEPYTEHTEIDPLAVVKEEPMSDSETPQDGSTMETPEEPTKMEETIGIELNTQKVVFLAVKMKENSVERPYECQICKKRFMHKKNLTEHSRIHSNVSDRPYECKLCKKGFTRKRTLTIHMKNHSDEREYECEVCGKGFNSKNAFVDHKKIHSGERPHECEICHKNFIHKRQLTAHLRIHGEKPFECEVCRKGFTLKKYLGVHMKIHSGERPYECEICKKNFVHKNYLTDHLRIHSDKKPFECEICKKNFINKSKLSIHLRVHSGERPFECEKCKRSFIRKDKLMNHMRKSLC